MNKLIRQGDILLERVEDIRQIERFVRLSETRAKAKALGVPAATEPEQEDCIVLAKGELTGHKHAVHNGHNRLYRDKSLSRDMEDASLYIGHLVVVGGDAVLRHEEHAEIALETGIYRVRRQREYHPSVNRNVAD